MTKSAHLELSQAELQMLVQSLSNCIDTCKDHGHQGSQTCPDCDAARKLRQRLQETRPS